MGAEFKSTQRFVTPLVGILLVVAKFGHWPAKIEPYTKHVLS